MAKRRISPRIQRRAARWTRALALLALAALLAACAREAATAAGDGTLATGAQDTPCVATDQDRYVWDPTRLQVVQPCLYVTGYVLTGVDLNADGDRTFLVRPDPPYQHLLQPSNVEDGVRGLDIEAVCGVPPMIPAVIALCAGDPDPNLQTIPPVGTHVWLEGRYVFDLHHERHAELHPLYRLGVLAP
jgi:hypothetical protein